MKKLTEEEIAEYSTDPNQYFDQCDECDGIQLGGTMHEVPNGDLICDECDVAEKTFSFFLDQKATTWFRTHFEIKASSLDEAKKLAIDFYLTGKTDDIPWGEIEGVVDIMDVEDNDGQSTAEIYYEMDSAFGNEEIYKNSNK